MTSDERHEVAERLREAVVDDGHVGRPYGEQGFQVTLRRIIGTSNPSRPTLYARLADLIDPTCHIALDDLASQQCMGPMLSCDRCQAAFPEINSPYAYCPNCGRRNVNAN